MFDAHGSDQGLMRGSARQANGGKASQCVVYTRFKILQTPVGGTVAKRSYYGS